MSVLRGPADADHYRVKIGRYGDRWYTDPLPGCPIAEASDWQGPSWSIVKGAAGKDWSYVTNKRNGYTPTYELERIARLEPAQRVGAFNAINKAGLGQAGGRGTIVHWWAEDLLAGKSPRTVTDVHLFSVQNLTKAALDEALTYLPALSAFFDHYQPEVIAAEYVALHRTLNGYGYGCTPDVIALIQGAVANIDWKTRGADSDHGCYPEEGAQASAGAKAEYMIITGPDGYPCRALIPKVDCGLIVSIKPDGCRVYPTDIDKGFTHLEAMHAFWVARLTEKAAIGKPWPPTPISDAARIPASDATGAPTPVAQPAPQEDLWTSASNTPSKPSKPSKPASAATRPTATTSNATTRGTTPAEPATDSPPTTTAPTASSTTHAYTSTDPADATPQEDDLWTTTQNSSPPSPGSPARSPKTSTSSTTQPNNSSTPLKNSAPPSPNSNPPDEFRVTSLALANAMAEWPPAVQAELAEWWPILTPTPDQVRAGEAVWTEAEIDHIEKMCDLANAPFWQTATTQTRAR